MATKKKANQSPPVESVKHKDKRANIPTEELRDPSLDPQLVWRGKDEQDREDLAVPALPVYIQEKIHPQAIIQDLRRMKGKKGHAQFNL